MYVDTETDTRITGFAASPSAAARTHAVWITDDGKTLYATNEVTNDIAKLDARTGTRLWNLPIGNRPSEILVTEDGKTAYVTIRNEDEVKVVDLTTNPGTIVGERFIGVQPDTMQLMKTGTLVVGLRGVPAHRGDRYRTGSFSITRCCGSAAGGEGEYGNALPVGTRLLALGARKRQVPSTLDEQSDLAEPAMEVVGSGPRVVLVHGSVVNARLQWAEQRPLASSFTLVLPNRSGYPPNPPLDYIDFEAQADDIARLLEDGSHLVGFSYGGIVALLAAGRRPEAVRSLTVIEPPALLLARGHPDVDRLALDMAALFWTGPREPRAFLDAFLDLIGGKVRLPRTLPPDLEQGSRALMVERAPWDARIQLETLARAPFPKLVVSGAHSPALDAICDVLEERLGAERAVVPGGNHNIPSTGARFNDTLLSFLERAEREARAIS